MSLVSAVLRAFNLMLQLTQLLGFTGIRYNKLEGRYELRPGFTCGRAIRTLLYALHMLAVCGYVIRRYLVERENYELNKIEPGFRPPFVLLELCEDVLMALSHFVICALFKLSENLLMESLNSTLLFVHNAKQVLKYIGSGSSLPLAVPLLLLLLTLSSLVCYCCKLVYERDVYYIPILLLCGSALFYHLHPLFYCLQLLLQHCFYAGMNRFMQQRLTARHIRCLTVFLQLLPALQRLHLPAASYFAPYMGLLLLRILLKCYAFLAACKYDEKSLALAFTLLISEEQQDEAEEDGNVPTYKISNGSQIPFGRAGVLLWILLRLVFLLLSPLTVLFLAHQLHREQSHFRKNLIKLVDNPQVLEIELQQQSEPTTSTSEQAASSRWHMPKINILELMVKTNLSALDFNNGSLTVLVFQNWELPLKSAMHWILKLVKTMIAAIIVDLGQQLDISYLHHLVREANAQRLLKNHYKAQ